MHSVMTIVKMRQEEMGENVIIKWVQPIKIVVYKY